MNLLLKIVRAPLAIPFGRFNCLLLQGLVVIKHVRPTHFVLAKNSGVLLATKLTFTTSL